MAAALFFFVPSLCFMNEASSISSRMSSIYGGNVYARFALTRRQLLSIYHLTVSRKSKRERAHICLTHSHPSDLSSLSLARSRYSLWSFRVFFAACLWSHFYAACKFELIMKSRRVRRERLLWRVKKQSSSLANDDDDIILENNKNFLIVRRVKKVRKFSPSWFHYARCSFGYFWNSLCLIPLRCV